MKAIVRLKEIRTDSGLKRVTSEHIGGIETRNRKVFFKILEF